MINCRKAGFAAFVLTAALSLSPLRAEAHAMLVSAEPAAQATLATAPLAIQLRFSEALEPKFSHVTLSVAGAGKLAVDVSAEQDHLIAKPRAPLTSGSYTVGWVAVASDDGHKTQGSFTFTVR